MSDKLKLKKGDLVIVISGEDRGRKGRVLKAYPKTNRVIVEKVHMIKKHTKPSQKNPQGGIVNKEAPVHASNVMLVDPVSGKRTRVGMRIESDGRKVRVSRRKDGGVIDK